MNVVVCKSFEPAGVKNPPDIVLAADLPITNRGFRSRRCCQKRARDAAVKSRKAWEQTKLIRLEQISRFTFQQRCGPAASKGSLLPLARTPVNAPAGMAEERQNLFAEP